MRSVDCVRRAIDFELDFTWLSDTKFEPHVARYVRFANLIDLCNCDLVFRSYVSIKPFIQLHRANGIIRWRLAIEMDQFSNGGRTRKPAQRCECKMV